jgi:hypothetical protein
VFRQRPQGFSITECIVFTFRNRETQTDSSQQPYAGRLFEVIDLRLVVLGKWNRPVAPAPEHQGPVTFDIPAPLSRKRGQCGAHRNYETTGFVQSVFAAV